MDVALLHLHPVTGILKKHAASQSHVCILTILKTLQLTIVIILYNYIYIYNCIIIFYFCSNCLIILKHDLQPEIVNTHVIKHELIYCLKLTLQTRSYIICIFL